MITLSDRYSFDACRRLQSGFTLMEVLVAIAIFAIGFTSIAAIFPVGTLLQKQTATAILARQVEHNAAALLKGNRIPITYLSDVPKTGLVVVPPDDLWVHYKRSDRSYPTQVEPSGDPYVPDFYWIPLIQLKEDADEVPALRVPADFMLYIFVLRNAQRSIWASDGSDMEPTIPATGPDPDDPPRVAGRPGLRRVEVTSSTVNFAAPVTTSLTVSNAGDLRLAPGDPILSDRGSVHRIFTIVGNRINVTGVVSPDPDHIFVAPGPQTGQSGSPAITIKRLGGNTFIQ